VILKGEEVRCADTNIEMTSEGGGATRGSQRGITARVFFGHIYIFFLLFNATEQPKNTFPLAERERERESRRAPWSVLLWFSCGSPVVLRVDA